MVNKALEEESNYYSFVRSIKQKDDMEMTADYTSMQ